LIERFRSVTHGTCALNGRHTSEETALECPVLGRTRAERLKQFHVTENPRSDGGRYHPYRVTFRGPLGNAIRRRLAGRVFRYIAVASKGAGTARQTGPSSGSRRRAATEGAGARARLSRSAEQQPKTLPPAGNGTQGGDAGRSRAAGADGTSTPTQQTQTVNPADAIQWLGLLQ
jgi:hypothetical protein